MMYIHDYTSTKIHFNNNENFPEIMDALKTEENSDDSEKKQKHHMLLMILLIMYLHLMI